jgi:hypothetical protein
MLLTRPDCATQPAVPAPGAAGAQILWVSHAPPPAIGFGLVGALGSQVPGDRGRHVLRVIDFAQRCPANAARATGYQSKSKWQGRAGNFLCRVHAPLLMSIG